MNYRQACNNKNVIAKMRPRNVYNFRYCCRIDKNLIKNVLFYPCRLDKYCLTFFHPYSLHLTLTHLTNLKCQHTIVFKCTYYSKYNSYRGPRYRTKIQNYFECPNGL